ncbi:Disease resistance protein RPM1 [Morus notabilis]|uniref:Disease resistance protein RPM1 n=1 Tax=Morus notabilis TaxID=981085 RepID=W9R2S7_9ROSA|nr:Disease resistance protein RPM1 [Morus notabilis]
MRELGNCIEDVVDDFLQYVEQQRGSTPARDNTVEEDDALRLNSLCIEKDELVGIDATSKELVDKLVKESSNKRMIISLVGEGGIGKTTLAKNAYDNEVVEAHFDCRAWITVSQSCDTKTLLGKMMKQIFPDEKDHQRKMERSPGEQVVLLRQHLKRKKYVVVFDDVWRQDFWGVIKQVVPASENQGRIILTTRDASVANAFREASDAHPVQELRPWSEELALTLFCKTAFSRKDIEEQRREELKRLSLEFVSKCQGLPLVIAAIGSLLSRKEKAESVWRNVLDDLHSESMTTYTGTSKIISQLF